MILEPALGRAGHYPADPGPAPQQAPGAQIRPADAQQYDCRRPVYQALASAEKWLLVTCFGYLGYKNARFGRIEAHEAVTAYGREALLRAKEAAEDMDFEILHMYVDGLWVQKPGCRTPADFEALLAEITERTGLPISMEGVYRWVVFLPSRVNGRVPVANRYFGVFQDGSIKVRGIEARRHDTAPFIVETQIGLLEILAQSAGCGWPVASVAAGPSLCPPAGPGAHGRSGSAGTVAGIPEAQPGAGRVFQPLAGRPRRLADAGRRQSGPARAACALPVYAWQAGRIALGCARPAGVAPPSTCRATALARTRHPDRSRPIQQSVPWGRD